jgi:hypothetical protein
MAKTIEEILGAIQDPESKTLLHQAIADREEKTARLATLEQKLNGAEIVPTQVAEGWRKVDAGWAGIQAGLKERDALKAEIEKLKPEAARAAILAKQIEEGQAIDPKDIVELTETSLKGKFLTPEQVSEIVKKEVAQASTAINMGSIPEAVRLVEASFRAERDYGLRLSAEALAEARNRYGSVDKAYEMLTADKAAEKRAAEAKRVDDEHKAAVAAALEEGKRQGRSESETRGYQPEESGMGGISPLVPPAEGENKGVNPMSYDPSAGVVAKEAAKLLQSQEREGLWGKQVM